MNHYSFLIIEDEVIAAMSLQIEFEAMGQKVVGVVCDQDSALKICESHKIDVILLDINLGPEINGIEIGKVIQSKYNIPILFMTGYEVSGVRREIGDLKTLGVVKKPVFAQDLYQITNDFYNPSQ